MALVSTLIEILQRPTIWNVSGEIMAFMAPLWVAVVVGVLVGWAWRPQWANFTSSSSSIPSWNSLRAQFISWIADLGSEKDGSFVPNADALGSSSSEMDKADKGFVEEDDLKHLSQLVEETDGGPAWIHMMDRSTDTISYQAWHRDPVTGPPQYRSRTVYEDTDIELMRDFFWDDEFRLIRDDMLLEAETLEECHTTGTMVVKWVRKFPFFCRDREYIIGRRIWDSRQSYYCVTKGVPYPSVERRNKPRRVDLYYSSWCIRAAESKRGDGKLTSCEVILFHHEDIDIPWEIAKLGVRQGMWGAVTKIQRGLNLYKSYRSSRESLSHCAIMAQINTKVSSEYLRYLESNGYDSYLEETRDSADIKPGGMNIPKLLIVGGTIALACTIDKGLLTKAVIYGVARRFAKIGRRL